MKVIVASKAGFCFGVNRAVEAVYENLNHNSNLYTLGPIIHNPFVVEQLKQKGALVEEDIDKIQSGTVVIRSHGVGQNIYARLQDKKLNIIDATCPFVKRIHKLVKQYSDRGYNIIIIGEREHPEVKGINGWCNNRAYIVYNDEDLEKIPCFQKACVVAQTTITQARWNSLIEKLHYKVCNMKIFNTICHTTSKRQTEAEEIAKQADIMFVIGGKNSSNTKKLYSICKAYCEKTFAIETAKEINYKVIKPGDVIGITAGASTPDWIIKEVVNKMEQLNEKSLKQTGEGNTPDQPENIDAHDIKEQDAVMPEQNSQGNETPQDIQSEDVQSMDDFEKTMVKLKNGQIVKGTVLSVKNDEASINIGYKSDGILSSKEMLLNDDQNLTDFLKPGQEIEVEVIKVNDGEGNVVLSYKSVQQKKVWDDIEQGYKSGQEFSGKCVEVVKGGVIALVNGLRVFIPASQISTKYIEDLSAFVGQTLRLKIIELERRRNRIVASHRAILEAEQKAKQEALWNSISEGQKTQGIVKNITNFGVFVDIGGVDGLIHISDLSWGHVKHPSEVLKEGQQLEVMILSIDKEKGRISLGYKQTLPHPWDNAEEKYSIGSIVSGKVVRITAFGAFVELEPGIDGLVHISQISNKHVNKVEDVLKIGDTIQAKVLNLDINERKIGLSIKEASHEPEEQKPRKVHNEPEYKKEDMMVSLGEFFPDDLSKDK